MGRRKRKPEEFENIAVTGAGAKGKAIAKAPDGKTLFVRGAVPGDVVDVRTVKKRKSYYEAIVTRYREWSPDRIPPVCSHFEHCGGCSWQHLKYEKQLYYKQNEVEQNLRRIGKLELPEVSPILGSYEQYYYRNKMEFSFSPKRWLTPAEIQSGEEIPPAPACGFHISGMWDKILDIETCHLQEEPSNAIRNFVKDKALELGIPFYDPRTREGLLRGLLLRHTTTGEWMALLQFARNDTGLIDSLMKAVGERFPGIDALLYVVNTKGNDTIYDLPVHVFRGKAYITEVLDGLRFRIHAKSFFQTNSRQVRRLYDVVMDYAGMQGNETVYDLYSGAGTIALYAARRAKRVIGVESVPEAVEDARLNARLNGIGNVEFVTGDMRDVFDEAFVGKYGKADLIIVDPPRAGMHPKVVERLARSRVPKIVYVSCNSATQARDLEMLKADYRITRVQPVDMFPQTYHVENVVLLERI